MAWPPVIPPNTRQNATLELDNHPSDHNAVANALTDIVARINAPPSVPWIAFPFASGWVNWGAGYQDVQYRLVAGEFVQIRGTFKLSTPAAPASQLAGTLPAGYRPVNKVQLAGPQVGSATAIAGFELANDGTFKLVIGSGAVAGVVANGIWQYSILA